MGLNQGLCRALKSENRQVISCLNLKSAREQLLCGSASLVLLALILNPIMGVTMSNMLWLLTYRFTIMPILLLLPVFVLLGVLVPLIIYRFAAKATIVERLRETES